MKTRRLGSIGEYEADVAVAPVLIAVELFETFCVPFHLYLQISETPVSFSAQARVPDSVPGTGLDGW